jgi:cytochrome c556
MRIRPVGVQLFHADTRTDRQRERERDRQAYMKKLIVAFGNFGKVPKIEAPMKRYS